MCSALARRRRLPRSGRLLALLLIPPLLLTGCTSQKTITPISNESLAAAGSPAKVHVTMRDGRNFDLTAVTADVDSLRGRISFDTHNALVDKEQALPGPRKLYAQGISHAVALDQVRTIEYMKQNTAATIVLVVLGFAVVIAIIAAIDYSEGMSAYSSGSCPLVSSWDGAGWQLESATFAGAVFSSVPRSETTALQHAVPGADPLHLRITGGTEAADFVDAVSVAAIDHAPDLTPVPDEQGRGLLVGALQPARVARDSDGRDVTARLAEVDSIVWESTIRLRELDQEADRDAFLDLTFEHPREASTTALVVDGKNSAWPVVHGQTLLAAWGPAYPGLERGMDANGEAARDFLRPALAAASLRVDLWDGSAWRTQGTLGATSNEVTKRQAVRLDLAVAPQGPLRVRLVSDPSCWILDRVRLAGRVIDAPPAVEQAPRRARTWDGRDVADVLAGVDGRRLELHTGQAVELEYDVPPAITGQTRSYLVTTNGWYRLRVTPAAVADSALIARVRSDPDTFSRLALERLNRLVAAMRHP